MSNNLSPNLIQRLQAGQTKAFTELFDLLSSQLLFFAKKLTQDEEEAKDITSSTFTKYWRNHQNFDSLVNIRAFLFITARNACLDYLRFKNRTKENNERYRKYLANRPETVFDPLKLEAGLLGEIYRQSQNLPARCRKIFELTYFEGMKASEIAKRMKITVSAVTTQRQRAIAFFRNVLRKTDL